MIRVRKSEERPHTQTPWLDSRHTFSFGEHYDPEWMGFRSLRVINEDWIRGGGGFGMHPHRDMEIITLVLEGALQHGDSLGNGSVMRYGEAQRMTAGRGIVHSEVNASETEPVYLLQIWIQPERLGLDPGYEQRSIAPEEWQGRLRVVAARDARDGAVTIYQDAALYLSELEAGQSVSHSLAGGRHAWLQVIGGKVELNGQPLSAGDGAAVSDEAAVSIEATENAMVLLFDLA